MKPILISCVVVFLFGSMSPVIHAEDPEDVLRVRFVTNRTLCDAQQYAVDVTNLSGSTDYRVEIFDALVTPDFAGCTGCEASECQRDFDGVVIEVSKDSCEDAQTTPYGTCGRFRCDQESNQNCSSDSDCTQMGDKCLNDCPGPVTQCDDIDCPYWGKCSVDAHIGCNQDSDCSGSQTCGGGRPGRCDNCGEWCDPDSQQEAFCSSFSGDMIAKAVAKNAGSGWVNISPAVEVPTQQNDCCEEDNCNIAFCGEDCDGETCFSPTPVCANDECVECVSDFNCVDPAKPVCDVATNDCVQCTGNSDCSAPTPKCCGSTCAECAVDSDCPSGGIQKCCAGVCADPIAGCFPACGFGYACIDTLCERCNSCP